MPFDMKQLASEWQAWFDEVMFDSKPEDFVKKFVEEAREFSTNPSLEEAVDVFSTLLAWFSRGGYTFSDFEEALFIKLETNRERKFVKQPDGTYHHI